jgi:hypothetical protein
MIDWVSEWPQIKAWSALRNVDPLFIAAIRHAENGGPGKELGCLSVGAGTYDAQLRVATRTIAGYVTDYVLDRTPGRAALFVLGESCGFRRLVYSPGFIAYVQQRWAPVGVANDPTALNANWRENVERAYAAYVTAGLPG